MDTSSHHHKSLNIWLILLAGCLLLTGLAAWLTPLEKTLDSHLRLVYLHGAWVWTGIIAFSAAALTGFLALILHRDTLHSLSRALGWTGLAFWLTYLPLSLVVMQVNWNGFFFAEPRWKVPFTFAVIGVLLQAGLLIINIDRVTSLANTLYAPALLFNLANMESVMHPENPVFSSTSGSLHLIFIILLFTTLLAATALTGCWWSAFPANNRH